MNILNMHLKMAANLYSPTEVARAAQITYNALRYHQRMGGVPMPDVTTPWSRKRYYDEATRSQILRYFGRTI